MTTVYGAWTPNSSDNQRMRLLLTHTVPTPAVGATTVTVTGSVKAGAGFGFTDSNNSLANSGSLLGSGSRSVSINVATGGEDEIYTFSKVVTLTTSAQGHTLAFSLTGVDYVGSSLTASVSTTVSIPAQTASAAPSAPTGVSVTRVSDARHDLAWSASGTIADFEVERWRLSNGNTDYYPAATPGGAARAWSDTTSMPNDRAGWRIRARNSAGVSAWVYTSDVYTTPAAATGLSVSRAGSEATVSWTVAALAAASQTIQSRTSADGVTWTAWADVAGHVGFSAAATSRVITGLVGGTHYQYRVVSTVTAPTTLVAYSSATGTLIPLAAPLAPTLTSPTGVVATDAATVMTWIHRTSDGTAQTAAEVQWRLVGGSWTTISGITTTNATTVTAGTWAAGTYEWQARTKGGHADWSPWSALGSFRVAARPAVAITSPSGATVAGNRLTAVWTYSDAQSAPMVSWRADLSAAGQWVETKTGTGAALTTTFDTIMADGGTYAVTVWAISGTGLTSSGATWSGTADYIDPATPSLSAIWDEPTGTVQLAATNPLGNGTTTDDPVSARIERSTDGGVRWVSLADLPLNAGLGDDTVALNVEALYRAVSVSALGAEAFSASEPVITATSRLWLQSDIGRVSLLHNLTMSPDYGHERVTERYLGDELGTAYYGTGRPLSVAVRGVWLDEETTQDRTVVLGRNVLYRDPKGRVFTASLTGMPGDDPRIGWQELSFTAEAVNG